jgi:hypothetical protein
MSKDRPGTRNESSDNRRTWRVVDDFPADVPVGSAELDAAEAFLMPLVNALLSEKTIGENSADGRRKCASLRPADSQAP